MRIMKKIAVSILVGACLLASLTGCSSLGKTMMTLGDSELTVNEVSLFLSRYKGTLWLSESSVATESYWNTIYDNKQGLTYNDYYTSCGLEAAKAYLAALHVFDEQNLTLPDSVEKEIDEKIDRLVEEEGSKSALNKKLGEYGANVKILKEVYLMEAKMAYLADSLYGSDGSLIDKAEKDAYYHENYRRFKQIFLPTYEYVYETNAQGEQVKVRDEDGYYKIRPLTDEEAAAVAAKKEMILNLTAKGDFEGFDALVTKYDEEPNSSSKTYPNGFYLSADSGYQITEVADALFEMEVGEIRTVIPEEGYGVYILMRYENEEDGYTSDANKNFFGDFTDNLKDFLIGEYLERYQADICVVDSVAADLDIKGVGINLYY